MPRPKPTHSGNCNLICIACLKKPKPSFTRNFVLKNGDNSFENTLSSRLYSDFFQDKEWLPKVICVNCKYKLLDEESEFEILVNYKALVENVKEEQNKANSNGEKCICEICRLVGLIVSPQNKTGFFESPFLLKDKPVVEEKVQKPKITNFLNPGSDQNEQEKIKDILEIASPTSLQKLNAAYLDKLAKESNSKELLLKRVRGPPLKVSKF